MVKKYGHPDCPVPVLIREYVKILYKQNEPSGEKEEIQKKIEEHVAMLLS